MSERIYRWLLQLYPSHFRDAYGPAALQLVRDRFRDERGFKARLQLWWDLFADLIDSVPREHWLGERSLAEASALSHPLGAPAFHVFESDSPRPSQLLWGCAFALIIFAAIPLLIGHGGSNLAAQTWIANRAAPQVSARSESKTNASGGSRSLSSQTSATTPGKLDSAERHRVVEGAIANLRAHYLNPAMANRIADALRAYEKSGDFNGAKSGQAFAELLTSQMREVSHDPHLIAEYSESPLPRRPLPPTAENLARYRAFLQEANCTFETVEVRAHNIGYLKLNSFPETAVCQSKAIAAMRTLNHADAIIFDLRDNGGGAPDMVALIASYLFDHPEYWYNPRENTTERSWTRSPVPGNRLADKPAYVLTSANTFSGAEQFSYDLKMLKRATLVGETTRGGAHAGAWHRIDDHFGMGIPETRAINPFSSADWEGTGVEPDVKVNASNALNTAEKLAQRNLRKLASVLPVP